MEALLAVGNIGVTRLNYMSLAIETFIENARVFCDWLESDRHDILAVRQTLLALLQGVPSLIATGADDNNTDAVPRRDQECWSADVARLSDLPLRYYRVAFHPLDLETESTVVGDVYDDLADIYGELWHGLKAFDSGATIYAVQHWHDSYRYHWGLHATGALSPLTPPCGPRKAEKNWMHRSRRAVRFCSGKIIVGKE